MAFTLNLHKNPNEYISRAIFNQGFWESPTTEVLAELFRTHAGKNLLFVDIGANIGYFTMLAASMRVKTIAFEPVTTNMNLMEKSIRDNENFDLYALAVKMALGKEEGRLSVKVFEYNMGYCTTRETPNETPSYVEDVYVNSFDNFFSHRNDYQFIVKIDVEEMEEHVLLGMEKSMGNGSVKYVLLELATFNQNIIDILARTNFFAVVNVGYDAPATKINFESKHLENPRLYNTIADYEKRYKRECENKVTSNLQRMLLFIHESVANVHPIPFS